MQLHDAVLVCRTYLDTFYLFGFAVVLPSIMVIKLRSLPARLRSSYRRFASATIFFIVYGLEEA